MITADTILYTADTIRVTADGGVQLSSAPDLVLGDRVLDYGLAALAEADTILVCTGPPADYAEAISLAVGEDVATFGAPLAGRVSSLAVTEGNVIGTGPAHRWAAVDTVNSRLLAHGDITGDDQIAPGVGWTLSPIVIVRPVS